MLLSDGEDTGSAVSEAQVLEVARRNEISIYPISLRPERVPEHRQQSFDQAQHFVSVLARESGGEVHCPGALSQLESVYGRVAEAIRTRYSLGYVSSNPSARRQVAADRRPHPGPRRREVRHKIGYYAPRT